MEHIKVILSQYGVGEIDKISKISTGLINETYLVETKSGQYILQKLNPIFKKEVNLDLDAVSRRLEQKGMTAQRILPTISGKLFVEKDKEIWRMLSFIPGVVFSTVRSPEIVYEAGKILGKFHLAVSDFDYVFKHNREMRHATKVFFAKLKEISANSTNPDFQDLTVSAAGIRNYYLPENLRKNITHGDPKLTNIIFDESEQGRFKAKALIDLDDCGRDHNLLIELGDAFRSWCGLEEDDARNFFDLEKFKAGLNGYLEGSQNFFPPEADQPRAGKKAELELLPSAIKLITLELAVRFLLDYLEDYYFGWDFARYASRKEHNLARAKGQISLFQDLERKTQEITAIAANLKI